MYVSFFVQFLSFRAVKVQIVYLTGPNVMTDRFEMEFAAFLRVRAF